MRPEAFTRIEARASSPICAAINVLALISSGVH
jgi:hypothetical protein